MQTAGAGPPPRASEPAEPHAPNGVAEERVVGAQATRSPFRFSSVVAGNTARAVLLLVLYMAGAGGLFRLAFQRPGNWIGGCCDPEQTMWFLRWAPFAVGHSINPFYTVYLNYPDGVNLMWNTSLIFPALLLAPVTLAFGPVAAYNVLLLLAVALSAWCACLALRRYANGWWGPAIGGAVYGFSPYVVSQAIAHADLAFVPIPPLLLILFDEIVVRQKRSPAKVGAFLGLLAAAQLLIDEEILTTAALVAALLLLTLALQARKGAITRLLDVILAGEWAFFAFVALAAWPLIEQFRGPQRLTGQIYDPGPYATDVLNFVVPTDAQAIAPAAALQLAQHFSGLEHEANAYLGFPLLLLLAFACGRLWGRPVVRAAAIMALAIAVRSMGSRLTIGGQATAIPLPWSLLGRLPILDDILTNRMTVFMYLSIGAILAVFIDDLTRGDRPFRRWPALLVMGLALLPLAPRLDFPSSTTTIPQYFRDWRHFGAGGTSVTLVAPRAEDGGGADQMLWQAVAGDTFAMPDGFFLIPGPSNNVILNARSALLFDQMDAIQQRGEYPLLDAADRRQLAEELRQRAIDTIVVGPMPHRDLTARYFSDLLGRGPQVVGGVEVWRQVRKEGVKLNPA